MARCIHAVTSEPLYQDFMYPPPTHTHTPTRTRHQPAGILSHCTPCPVQQRSPADSRRAPAHVVLDARPRTLLHTHTQRRHPSPAGGHCAPRLQCTLRQVGLLRLVERLEVEGWGRAATHVAVAAEVEGTALGRGLVDAEGVGVLGGVDGCGHNAGRKQTKASVKPGRAAYLLVSRLSSGWTAEHADL